MQIKLQRYSYSPTETEGIMTLRKNADTLRLRTIERPWIPNPNGAKGGKPWESCVPDGTYVLSPWTRPDGDKVFILYSPKLGVYRTPDEHEPDHGRNLILIHVANWVDQVAGCIAPGVARVPMERHGRMQQAVANSGAAMSMLRTWLGSERSHTLWISNTTGAYDVSL